MGAVSGCRNTGKAGVDGECEHTAAIVFAVDAQQTDRTQTELGIATLNEKD